MEIEKRAKKCALTRRWREKNPEKAKQHSRDYEPNRKRAPLTRAQRDVRNAKKREKRATRTPVKLEKDKAYEKKYNALRRSTLKGREDSKARSRARWLARTPEMVEKDRIRAKKRKESLSTEQRFALNARHRELHAMRTPEQIARCKASIFKQRATRRKAAGHGYTTATHITERWEMFGGRCWMCGCEATCTDHVKPLNAKGADLPSNLRPACKPCNSSKGAKWPYPTSTVAA
tara:strand:+ start:1076 stop:1774 length:699 start_codon:yes stop_codon:yes gene_type:complete